MTFRTLIVLFFLAFSAAESAGAEPVKIGLTLGLSGKYAAMADMQIKGFRLWERDVNDRGGILGRQVRITIHDDKSDPQTAIGLYEQLIHNDKVDMLFGPYSSEITEVILPLTEKYGYPVIASGASADSIWQKGNKYVFGLLLPASKYTTSFLEMLVVYNLRDVAIIYADDQFSKKTAEGAKKWAERFGLNVVLFEGFKKGTMVLDEYAKKAHESKTDALIMCGHFNEAENMRLSMKNIGWYPKAYFATVGPATELYGEKLKKDADLTYSSSQWEPHAKFPHSKDFYAKFTKTYEKNPSYHAAEAYASGQLIEAAVKKAGAIDRKRIRDLFSSMDTMTIIGRYGVDRTGMQVKHFNLIIQWQKGKKEIVWPEEIRTARPVFK